MATMVELHAVRTPPTAPSSPVDEHLAPTALFLDSSQPSPLSPTNTKHVHPTPRRGDSRMFSDVRQNLESSLRDIKLPQLPQVHLPTIPSFGVSGIVVPGFLTGFMGLHAVDEEPPKKQVPEIFSQDEYVPKGEYKSIGEFKKVYVVGPDPAPSCIVCCYDIFGFYPQTIQGADILHYLTGSTIYIPDFFRENAFPTQFFPPKGAAQIKALQSFFATRANIDDRRDELMDFGLLLRSRWISAQSEETVEDLKKYKIRGALVAAYGLSWGGKLTFLAGSQDIFYSVAAVHPAMLTLPDAEALKVPMGLFPSKDEPADIVKQCVEAFQRKTFFNRCICRTWPTMHHGFGGARANLMDPEVKESFSELYSSLAEFFIKARQPEVIGAEAGGERGTHGNYGHQDGFETPPQTLQKKKSRFLGLGGGGNKKKKQKDASTAP